MIPSLPSFSEIVHHSAGWRVLQEIPTFPMLTDLQLLSRYHESGDAMAFRDLMQAHAGMVFSTARRITQDEALAEDVARFIEHKPVMARPPSMSYVALRFARRACFRAMPARRRSSVVVRKRSKTGVERPSRSSISARRGSVMSQVSFTRSSGSQRTRSAGVNL